MYHPKHHIVVSYSSPNVAQQQKAAPTTSMKHNKTMTKQLPVIMPSMPSAPSSNPSGGLLKVAE